MLNALLNSKRRKSKRFIELFKKRRKKVDKEFNANAMEAIERTEKKEGKSWVEKIYAAVGRKVPKAPRKGE